MGIVEWHDRELKEVKKPIYLYEAFCNEKMMGLFLMEHCEDQTIWKDAEKLLNQMAKALGFSIKHQTPLLFENYQIKKSIPYVIILGKNLNFSKEWHANKIITTHDVFSLLTHPELKKESWKDLQVILRDKR